MRTIDPSKPMIALTFDDGPSEETERLLDILRQYDARATFFLIGRKVGGGQKTVLRAVNEGHEIGSHTWDHPCLTDLTDDCIRMQIASAKDKICEITKGDHVLMRPPFCAIDARVQAIGRDIGVSFVNCTTTSDDWNTTDPHVVYKNILDRVRDRDVILCHDKYPSTVDAMEGVISQLIKRGYQLVTVSELFRYSNITLEPGELYPPDK